MQRTHVYACKILRFAVVPIIGIIFIIIDRVKQFVFKIIRHTVKFVVIIDRHQRLLTRFIEFETQNHIFVGAFLNRNKRKIGFALKLAGADQFKLALLARLVRQGINSPS